MPDLGVLCDVAKGLLPSGCALGWADPQEVHPLMEGETLPGAVDARLREFGAGRAAARRAMHDPGIAIPVGADRAPVWPKGMTGSITHSQNACLAAVASGTVAKGIGIDIEDDTPLDPNLWDEILVPEELHWLASQPQAQQGRLAKLIFSAKEAAYKAQYAQSRTLFGFEALLVQVEGAAFTATFRKAVHPFPAGTVLAGRYAHSQDHILTAVFMAA